MKVKLLTRHVIAGDLREVNEVLELPPGVAPSPEMVGLDREAIDAIAALKRRVFGRWVGWPRRLLDDPPIERPLDDPQPVPPIGEKGPR